MQLAEGKETSFVGLFLLCGVLRRCWSTSGAVQIGSICVGVLKSDDAGV